MLSLLLLGFLLGMRHALEADHLAAVTSLAIQTDSFRQAAKHGAIWGIGHTLALLVFCTISLSLDSLINQRFSSMLESIVGLMLIALGCDVIYKLIKNKIHFHFHQHESNHPHFHAHSHGNEMMSNHSSSPHNHQHNHHFPYRTLMVGLMHGMAGSAALILLTLKMPITPAIGFLYILLFGLGSIIGMTVLSVIIVVPLLKSAKRLTWIYNAMHVMAGTITIVLGLSILFNHLSFL